MEPRPDESGDSARLTALRALGHEEGPLHVGGVSAAELLARFGSPLYAYDAGVLERQIAAVRRAFGPDVSVAFALKANPSLALAAVARRAGAGADVASAGEILLAQAAGFTGPEIQFAGPGKSDEDLRIALGAGARIHIESEREHERLATLARTAGVRPDVAIRVNLNAINCGGSNTALGDTVFFDFNEDGLQDILEPGIAGVTVNLIDANTGAVIIPFRLR